MSWPHQAYYSKSYRVDRRCDPTLNGNYIAIIVSNWDWRQPDRPKSTTEQPGAGGRGVPATLPAAGRATGGLVSAERRSLNRVQLQAADLVTSRGRNAQQLPDFDGKDRSCAHTFRTGYQPGRTAKGRGRPNRRANSDRLRNAGSGSCEHGQPRSVSRPFLRGSSRVQRWTAFDPYVPFKIGPMKGGKR
jgi:hypothetical protein